MEGGFSQIQSHICYSTWGANSEILKPVSLGVLVSEL